LGLELVIEEVSDAVIEEVSDAVETSLRGVALTVSGE
jgi:hypothetical protein